jgi:hypothetical protein
MKCTGVLVAALLVTTSVAQDFVPATVIAIKKYDRGRIQYWEGRVPIYEDRPVFDITFEVGQDHTIVRYESNSGYYPQAWNVGQQIQVTKKSRGLYLLKRGNEEIPARVVSDHDCVINPTRSNTAPVLPCP